MDVEPKREDFGRGSDAQKAYRIACYRSAGYYLIPLRAKTPVHKRWQKRDYSSFDLVSWLIRGGNIGIRLRASDLIIDCDPRNYQPGDDPLRRLSEAVSAPLRRVPAHITGACGLRLFFRKPPALSVVENLVGYDGLDILTEGKVIVAPPSIHPQTLLPYVHDGDMRAVQMAPEALLELLATPEEPKTGTGRM